jgi:hypothetical protein
MRFWLPYKIEIQDQPTVITDDMAEVEMYRSKGYKITKPTLRVARLKLAIRGEYKTSKKAEAVVLMKIGGMLRFDPMDAVREGLLTLGNLVEMGLVPAPKDEPVPAPVVVEEVAEPMPDFDVMGKDALVAWADDRKPPIHLDRRKRKDILVAEVREALGLSE